ncbi:hypothetical protein pmac_cds_757 [Pandoravirus macleodensis]|uniref:Uncharacterized protein n=1 Tax=Pandoravirus macleodensis TaxID=2107707 RepID=A0A2U7UGC2_9VIRU|nr:hypothetical protein pmac_cds_757 [Pandoravirus macleodensis]AVK77445.1 hypothetical protein pmac_cds_757 [Pandoravirus macleodensis]
MQRRAVAASVLSRVHNNCQKVAGYGETTSVGAWVVGLTRDGRQARMGLAVAYEFRGRDAHAASSAEDHSQFRLHGQGSGRAAFFGPPSAHTWWPEQVHLCAALASVCGQVGTDALSDLSESELTGDATSIERVGDVVYQCARTRMRDWGVLPLATVAGVWPLSNDAKMSSHVGRPFSDAAYTDTHPWGAVEGLPSADHELRAFFDHTLFRSAALGNAVATGHHPYSYDGVRLMFRHLAELEGLVASQGRSTDVLKSMRLQLYAARHRPSPQ